MVWGQVFGNEWEMTLGREGDFSPLEPRPAVKTAMQAILRRTPWLPSPGDGFFAPGFRCYRDQGNHLEIASFEVCSPFELVELREAIFALLVDTMHGLQREHPGLLLFANNHDYLNEGVVWGCHENYSIGCGPTRLAAGMLPFLATRCLFAGNGRIDARGRLLLSSRALAMRCATGGNTTERRALYSTARNEPLMTKGTYVYRLHLICGDTLRSQLGELLKTGTTSLVLHWLQAHPDGADDLQVSSPLSVLHDANCFWDPNSGLRIDETALKIQEAYCDRVRRHLDTCGEKPDWCELVANRWAQTLQTLREDPLQLCEQLDPFIKLSLMDATLEELGHGWQDIADNRKLYQQLALVDVAYHQLSEKSPFAQLDGEGVLQHRVLPEGSRDSLLTMVSRLQTRAAPRARLIAKWTGSSHVLCYWHGLWRTRPKAWIDLGDPTETDVPAWQDPDEKWPSWM